MPEGIFVDGFHGNNGHLHVGKFEKGRSDFKENCLRLCVVGGCHGNQISVMGVM